MAIYYQHLKEGGELDLLISDIFNEFKFKSCNKIFIKPNFSGRPPIMQGENTSLLVLESVVKTIIKYNDTCEILIGHYPLLSLNPNIFPFDSMIKIGGYDKLLKYRNVKFVDLSREEHRYVVINKLYIFIPKILDNVDYIINVPKAKTHMETQVSLSIKNLMGLIDGNSRKNFHKFFLNELLGYLGVYIKPNLNIIDGLVSMEGDGPHEGQDKKTNFIAAGDNLVELDSLVAHLMGFDFKKIIHINKARELGVGDYVVKDVIDKYQSMIHDFKKPQECMVLGRKIFFWPTTSCSLCHEVMRGMKRKMKKNIFLGLKFYYYAWFSRKKINIIIGRCENMPFNQGDINICIGICTKWFSEEHNLEFILGCPPSEDEVIEKIFSKIKNI